MLQHVYVSIQLYKVNLLESKSFHHFSCIVWSFVFFRIAAAIIAYYIVCVYFRNLTRTRPITTNHLPSNTPQHHYIVPTTCHVWTYILSLNVFPDNTMRRQYATIWLSCSYVSPNTLIWQSDISYYFTNIAYLPTKKFLWGWL